MPFWFLPKEVGLKGAVYADAGGLYDYKGPTSWALTERNQSAGLCGADDDCAGQCRNLYWIAV